MDKYIYIYGINAIIESLLKKNNKINYLYVNYKYQKFHKIIDLAKSKNIKIKYINKEQLLKLINNKKNSNFVLEMCIPKYWEIKTLINKITNIDKSLILMLDKISDSYNFGAILRTCDLFNVDGVIILNKCQVNINSIVANSSSGAFNYVKICKVNNLTNAIQYLKQKGYWIYTTNLNKKYEKIINLKYNTPIVLILGNEKKGISQKILNHSDFNICIPTKGHLNSLNVSTAAAILIYQIKIIQKEI